MLIWCSFIVAVALNLYVFAFSLLVSLLVGFAWINVLVKRGKALRLQKVKPDSCANTLDCPEEARACLETLEKVFTPLLGKQHVPSMVSTSAMCLSLSTTFDWLAVGCYVKEAVELPKDFLAAARLLSKREGDCDQLAPYGLLCDDLLGGPVAVEIKPKWGFLPKIEGQKQKTCRFCMHSHLRGSHSYYCPLDLYSGDRNRVKTALNALITAPRNNFRVIMNEPFTHEALVALLTEILVSDSILPNLVKLQSSLDELDVEAIWPMYEKHKDQLHNLTINDWVQAVQNYQNQTARDDPKQRIMEYVLSMTFKDCSVIVTIGAS